jgi:hypothetical protein
MSGISALKREGEDVGVEVSAMINPGTSRANRVTRKRGAGNGNTKSASEAIVPMTRGVEQQRRRETKANDSKE